MSTSTATTAPGSEPATRPDGPGWSAFFLDLFGRLDAKTLLETERGRVLDKDHQGAGGRRRDGQEMNDV